MGDTYKKISILYILVLFVLIDRLLDPGWIFRSLVCFGIWQMKALAF